MAYVPTEKQELLCGKVAVLGNLVGYMHWDAAPEQYHAAMNGWSGAAIEEPPIPMCDESICTESTRGPRMPVLRVLVAAGVFLGNRVNLQKKTITSILAASPRWQ